MIPITKRRFILISLAVLFISTLLAINMIIKKVMPYYVLLHLTRSGNSPVFLVCLYKNMVLNVDKCYEGWHLFWPLILVAVFVSVTPLLLKLHCSQSRESKINHHKELNDNVGQTTIRLKEISPIWQLDDANDRIKKLEAKATQMICKQENDLIAKEAAESKTIALEKNLEKKLAKSINCDGKMKRMGEQIKMLINENKVLKEENKLLRGE